MASQSVSDTGSFTPSEKSDGDDHSEHDSDYETDDGEEENRKDLGVKNVQWTGYGKRTPVILFSVEPLLNKKNDYKLIGERYHLAYKFGSSECKIVRNILTAHGFHEVHPNSADFNLIWTNSHLKPFTLRTMTEFQRINHFPRSYELTRKDRLFKNIQRMQQLKGLKHFDFIPNSFILPGEYQEFCSSFLREKGHWIVKPVASSRGRGVFLINHPDQVPIDENVIICRYISNPLLIDGFKFDVRLYVTVTSYDPLVIYLFEEGLTRFATVKFEKSNRSLRNQCMHLTNYSVNKKNQDYVKNDDPEVEDYGNKWSLGAMLRYLRSEGKDTAALMMRIEDVVIKTIISAELQIATACKMFMPHRGNCFELYGFDILIDENLKPWILEVNLSPSLACDTPLDLKIKSNLLCDLFGLAGVVCHDPMMRTMHQSKRNQDIAAKIAARSKSARVRPLSAASKPRPMSANTPVASIFNEKPSSNSAMSGLNSEEIKMVRRIKEEDQRRGGWVRIMPTADSWEIYSYFLQFNTTHNLTLHQKLYPERHKTNITRPVALGMTSVGSRSRTGFLQITGSGQGKVDQEKNVEAYAQAILRTRQYERRLGHRKRKNRSHLKKKTAAKRDTKSKLVQGVVEEADDYSEQQCEEDSTPATETQTSPVESQSLETQTFNKEPEFNIKETEKKIIVEVEPDVPPPHIEPLVATTSLPALLTEEDKTKSVYVEDNERGRPEPSANSKHTWESKIELPPPEPVLTKPQYDVVNLLKKGETLSKIQARSAFAMYLIRVQYRLMSNLGPMTQEDTEALNEQMDLVLRFLKRAAVNLQQPFKVIVPSRKLVLADRRRILAKQLGDFVHIYNKETEQLRTRRKFDKRQIPKSESSECLNEYKFERFVNTASEGELEEVLTTYTKLNKSASIFLGSNSKSPLGGSQGTAGMSMLGTRSDSSLLKRKDSTDGITTWDDVPRVRSASHTDIRHDSTGVRNQQQQQHTSSFYTPSSSYASAVTIYSKRLVRPQSATPQRTGANSLNSRGTSTFSRPSTASTYITQEPTVDTYNEQAIHDALQRLSLRQQARQYAALNGTSVLPEQSTQPQSHSAQIRSTTTTTTSRLQMVGDTANNSLMTTKQNTGARGGSHHYSESLKSTEPVHKYISMEEHMTRSRPSSASSHISASTGPTSLPPQGNSRRSRPHTNVNLQNANLTFNNFIDESGAQWHNSQNHQSSSLVSRQYQLTQQTAAKQQRLMEQSKQLLEQSKAKHQAMVAQAHAAQRTTEMTVDSTDITFNPKPPLRPAGKKPMTSHRLARTAIADDDGALTFNFYKSLKYDIHTGKTHLKKGEGKNNN
ncbi:tubulin polyglutamylase TTLL5-like [Gigantopelta aegis]|uniref:tubulin polyglutamylase TTLL5-like n=1 Tax=Gigantopelta aegis TaxID=1735272 RepID=UPI001B88A6A4|nr:tubulin polyglutamylase TTLL5-like [Gigantopelta aegis]